MAELGCAVVAMHHPVLDEFAVGFADAFYDRMFRQGQAVDRAVPASVPAALGSVPSSAVLQDLDAGCVVSMSRNHLRVKPLPIQR